MSAEIMAPNAPDVRVSLVRVSSVHATDQGYAMR